MTLYILTVRVISSYSVHESTILFQWFILLKTLKHVISSSEKKKKRNMLSDNRALVENNYHKYAVIMLVKTHITKKNYAWQLIKKDEMPFFSSCRWHNFSLYWNTCMSVI